MNKRIVFSISAAAAAVAIIALLYFSPAERTKQTDQQSIASMHRTTTASPATQATPSVTDPKTSIEQPTSKPTALIDTHSGFKVTADGSIVKDEAARLKLEELYALNAPQELAAKLRALQETLPPNAAQEITELMDSYKNYQVAALQTFPPGREPPSIQDAINEIDGTHALRVQYFGKDTAEKFFGSEERVQRELLQLMALEKDGSLTMEEKAEKAQALYARMPEYTALESAQKQPKNLAE